MDDKKNFQFEGRKDTPLGALRPEMRDHFETMRYKSEDFYYHFPCFLDAKNISRFISIYECYQKTLHIAGHMAEVGVYRGAVTMFLAKLSLLYEPQGMTMVHGFDWFREPPQQEMDSPESYAYFEPYERICDLINVQKLQRYISLHRINVITELKDFFVQHSHLQFKLIMLDAGDYRIVSESIKEFWPRLTTGGIMIFDQFNHEVAPGETQAIKELLPADTIIRTFPNGWMPTAYVIKGERV